MNTPTPETDAMAEQCHHQINVPTNPVPAEFARKLERERNQLARWKKEALTVEGWWKEIDEFVRNHPSVTIGDTVVHTAMRMLRERDRLNGALQTLINLNSGIADGGDGITGEDWEIASYALIEQP